MTYDDASVSQSDLRICSLSVGICWLWEISSLVECLNKRDDCWKRMKDPLTAGVKIISTSVLTPKLRICFHSWANSSQKKENWLWIFKVGLADCRPGHAAQEFGLWTCGWNSSISVAFFSFSTKWSQSQCHIQGFWSELLRDFNLILSCLRLSCGYSMWFRRFWCWYLTLKTSQNRSTLKFFVIFKS